MVGEGLLIIVGQPGEVFLATVELFDAGAGLAFEPTAGFRLGDDALVDVDGLGGMAARFLDLAGAQGGGLVVSLVFLERLADFLEDAGVVGKLGGEFAPGAQ